MRRLSTRSAGSDSGLGITNRGRAWRRCWPSRRRCTLCATALTCLVAFALWRSAPQLPQSVVRWRSTVSLDSLTASALGAVGLSGSFGRRDNSSGAAPVQEYRYPAGNHGRWAARALGHATSRKQLPRPADILSVKWGADDVNASSFAAGSSRIGSIRQPCPVDFPRLTPEQMASGSPLPYLFGGQSPNCRQCQSTDHWTTFCKFESKGPICGTWLRDAQLRAYRDRGWDSVLTATPCDLWRFVRGRTLWVMGDSQSLDLFKALQCFLHEFYDSANATLPQLASLDPATYGAQWEFAVRPRSEWERPACASMLESTALCFYRCNDYACMRDFGIPLMLAVSSPRDVLVMNFGLHFIKDYAEQLTELMDMYNDERPRMPFLLWMETPPQHFKTLLGEYSGGKPPFQCAPIGNGSFSVATDHTLEVVPGSSIAAVHAQHILRSGWRNSIASEVMADKGVPVVPTYNETVPLWEHHRDNGNGHECTHFCFPSAPQVWVHGLMATMHAYAAEMNEHIARHDVRAVVPV